jgi:SAM-dependent methyltransferase
MKILEYYRMHDDFRRYLVTDAHRVKELQALFSANKKYFGKRVLDLACGGGVLGFLLEPHGYGYVGVDINPDAIRSAKAHATKIKSRNRFVVGDVRTTSIEGSFDTVALLGNALIHLNAEELRDVLGNVRGNAAEDAYFLIHYRDVVSSLFHGGWKWKGRYVETRSGKEIVSVTKEIDTQAGEMTIESSSAGRRKLEFTAAIWSPFILQGIMESNAWRLERRRSIHDSGIWLDVYRRNW